MMLKSDLIFLVPRWSTLVCYYMTVGLTLGTASQLTLLASLTLGTASQLTLLASLTLGTASQLTLLASLTLGTELAAGFCSTSDHPFRSSVEGTSIHRQAMGCHTLLAVRKI